MTNTNTVYFNFLDTSSQKKYQIWNYDKMAEFIFFVIFYLYWIIKKALF